MRQRIGHRPLKQLLEWSVNRFAGSQEGVELLKRGEKSFNLLLPRQGFRVVPLLLAHGNRQPPVKQISHVRQKLLRSTDALARLKFREALRSLPHGLSASIGQRGQGVPQQFPLGTRGRLGMSRIAHADKITLVHRSRKVWRKESNPLLPHEVPSRNTRSSQVLPHRLPSAGTTPSIIAGESIATAGIS